MLLLESSSAFPSTLRHPLFVTVAVGGTIPLCTKGEAQGKETLWRPLSLPFSGRSETFPLSGQIDGKGAFLSFQDVRVVILRSSGTLLRSSPFYDERGYTILYSVVVLFLPPRCVAAAMLSRLIRKRTGRERASLSALEKEEELVRPPFPPIVSRKEGKQQSNEGALPLFPLSSSPLFQDFSTRPSVRLHLPLSSAKRKRQGLRQNGQGSWLGAKGKEEGRPQKVLPLLPPVF